MEERDRLVAAMILRRFAMWLMEEQGLVFASNAGLSASQQSEYLTNRALAWIRLKPWQGDELLKDLLPSS